MLKPRDWQLDAHEFMRRHGGYGHMEMLIAAMSHAYQLGVKDTTEVMRAAVDKTRDDKERSAMPR